MNPVNGNTEATNDLERVVFNDKNGMDVLAKDVKEAAEHFHVEHLRATVDSTFKKLFLNGIEKKQLDINRSLLVRTVKLLTEEGCSADEITGFERNEQLKQYDIDSNSNNAVTLMQETLIKDPKSIKKDALKVDFAAKVTMKKRESERKNRCVFGVEIQVENNLWNPIPIRQLYYGNALSRESAEKSDKDGKAYALKVFSSAICMWENQYKPDALVSIQGMERNEFYSPSQGANNSVFYKDIQYPVCCAQIFLGKWVNALKKSTAIDNETAGYAIAGYEATRKKKQEELMKKFENTFRKEEGYVQSLREYFKEKIPQDEKQYGETSGGLSETNLLDAEKEDFKILESYELLEFFLLGNLTTKRGVEAEVVSNSVRNLYMNTRATMNNIANDEEQASSIWYANELEKSQNELEKSQKELKKSQKENDELNTFATSLLFERIKMQGGKLFRTDVESLIHDKEMRDRIVDSLKNKYKNEINITGEGDICIILPPASQPIQN